MVTSSSFHPVGAAFIVTDKFGGVLWSFLGWVRDKFCS